MVSDGALSAIVQRLDRSDVPDARFPDARGEYWAHCPYPDHEDSTPSFSVSERGYHCFGCGREGGLSTLASEMGIAVVASPPEGCTLEAYAQAKHLPVAFLQQLGLETATAGRAPVLRVPYRSEQGQLLRVRRRHALHRPRQGKDNRFSWERDHAGQGLYLYGLWRWAEVLNAGWVVLVEGESDCQTLWHLGLPAIGAPGADTFRLAWASRFEGLQVYVWQEPDRGGALFVERVRRALPQARVLTPPKGVKDVSDAHCQGKDVAALLEELKTAASSVAAAATLPQGPEHCTDLGNARRLVARHGQDLRYCAALGGWLVWDGKRWALDETGQVARYAKDTVQSIYVEASEQGDEHARAELGKHAARSESAARIHAMIELAQTEPGIMVTAGVFDADPWLLNVANGTLDLHTGQLRPHDRADMLTKLAPVTFDPNATDDTLDRYLHTATNGDSDFAAYLQRAAGYSLTGLTSEECFFLVLGPAATGKSTLVEALLTMLGDYGIKSSFAAFLESRNTGGATPEIARLRGARLVAAVESPKDGRLNEVAIKELTGGDTVTARNLYAAPFSFKPQFKLWLAANDCPRMTDTDTGLWRRLQRLPFEHELPEGRRDPRVKQRLCNEALPALLAWAVKGCLAWQSNGLKPAAVVRTKTAELRADFDPLAEFLGECCVFASRAETPALELRQAYEAWAASMGARPINNRDWSQRLKARGCENVRTRRGGSEKVTFWRGVGLLTEAPLAQPAQQEEAEPASGHNGHNKRHFAQTFPDSVSRETFVKNGVCTARPAQMVRAGDLTESERYYLALAEQEQAMPP